MIKTIFTHGVVLEKENGSPPHPFKLTKTLQACWRYRPRFKSSNICFVLTQTGFTTDL